MVGDKLSDQSKNGVEIANIGRDMYRCAAQQHHAKAANKLGISLQVSENYSEATKYFQIGVLAGNPSSASRLSKGFSSNGNADEIFRLDQPVDTARQDRYYKVWNFLADYDYLNPTVPEIDEIVPLPPAKLPPWDGKFKWLEEHKANVAPPLPSDERIAEMARAKGLDPKTGRPLTGATK